MNKIDLKFKELREKNKKAIIPFIAMGSRSMWESIEIAEVIEAAGASILEIGIPYSDPIVHEPVIQEAYHSALLSGVKFKECLKAVDKITSKLNLPVIIAVYYNSIYCKGIKYFVEEISKVKVSGLIVYDIPLEESVPLYNECTKHNIALIPIVAITSKERIRKITEGAVGFVNCIAPLSQEEEVIDKLEAYLKEVRSYTKMPICIDLNPLVRENSYKIKECYDGIQITSDIVKIMNSEKSFTLRTQEIFNFIRKIRVETAEE